MDTRAFLLAVVATSLFVWAGGSQDLSSEAPKKDRTGTPPSEAVESDAIDLPQETEDPIPAVEPEELSVEVESEMEQAIVDAPAIEEPELSAGTQTVDAMPSGACVNGNCNSYGRGYSRPRWFPNLFRRWR